MNRRQQLAKAKADNLAAARRIADAATAAGRDFTEAERAAVTSHVDQARAAHQELKGLSGDDALVAELNALGGSVGRRSNAPRPTPWGDAAVKASSDPTFGFKALVAAGSTVVPVPLSPEIVRDGQRVRFLRSLIPSEPNDAGRFSYLRQTARTNNAAPVAEGALKPTSLYTVELVEDRARTIAHLSEAIPRQQIDDAARLREFVEAEMKLGLEVELDEQILLGSGVGESFEGVHTVAGTQAQAWDTNLLVTTRKAVTKLETIELGEQPGLAWVFNPEDWERFELTRDDSGGAGTGGFLLEQGPIDRAARRLWGFPVIVSNAEAAGTGILGDFGGSARLWLREEATLTWSENVYDPNALGAGVGASDFSRNMVRFRCELRAGFGVLRPDAFVELDLTAL